MGETSVKCCDMLAPASTTNVRSKSSSSIGKTRPTVVTTTVNGNIESRPCTSPPYELDHMYANNNICGNGGGDANIARRLNCAAKLNSTAAASSCDVQRQLSCMRELVFLHLDLIQQQQEQLDSREKQIAVLRQDSKELRDQLDSTEARLATFKRENDRLRGIVEPIACANSKNRQRNVSAGSFPLKSNGNRIRNRNSSSTESSTTKRIRYDDESGGSSGAKKLDRKSSTSCPQSLPLPPPPPPPPPPKRDDLQTDVTYYTCIGATNAVSTPVVDESVLVPCWRVRLITSCYQMEGTENLDDDIFMKRHQKLEIDEKRRKRWDIQRIREQRLQEKLRKGRQARLEDVRNRSPDLGTLYPRAEDVQAIEVAERLPVLAFGYPIPSISDSEFQVPWLDLLDKSWSEIGRPNPTSKRSTLRRDTVTSTTAATDDEGTSKETSWKKHGADRYRPTF